MLADPSAIAAPEAREGVTPGTLPLPYEITRGDGKPPVVNTVVNDMANHMVNRRWQSPSMVAQLIANHGFSRSLTRSTKLSSVRSNNRSQWMSLPLPKKKS